MRWLVPKKTNEREKKNQINIKLTKKEKRRKKKNTKKDMNKVYK